MGRADVPDLHVPNGWNDVLGDDTEVPRVAGLINASLAVVSSKPSEYPFADELPFGVQGRREASVADAEQFVDLLLGVAPGSSEELRTAIAFSCERATPVVDPEEPFSIAPGDDLPCAGLTRHHQILLPLKQPSAGMRQ